MRTTWEYVCEYRKIGWTVIPAPLGKKFPLIAWKKYQTVRPTDEEYALWFFNTNCNILLVTGALSGVMVVDLDSYKKTYSEVNISSPVASKTARGGTHLFFKYNPLYSQNKVLENAAVDIRSEGGLIVLPPSIFEEKPYTWVSEAADFHHLPEFGNNDLLSSLDKPVKQFDIKEYFEVEEGSRNISLFKVACNLIRLHKNDPKTAFYFTRLAGEDYQPALSLSDIRTIFKSAYKDVKSNPTQDYTIAAVKDPNEKKVISSSTAIKMADSLQKQIDIIPPIGIKEIDAMIKFIPGELYLISAETHVGKTLFALQIATAISINNKKKILFISLESGYLILKTVQYISGGVSTDSMYWYFPLGLITYKELEEALGEDDFEMLFIDHLHFFNADKERTMGETINSLILQIQLLARRKNIPVVVLCHLRKNTTSKDGNIPTLSDLKDTSSLAQIPSVIMLLYREKNNNETESYLSSKGKIIVAKNRFGDTGVIPFQLKKEASGQHKFVFDVSSDNTINIQDELKSF